jgi:hypothetical protein
MKELYKIKCKDCGHPLSLLRGELLTDGESSIIPVYFAKTVQSIGKYYKKTTGSTYLKDTGNKIKDVFYKKKIKLTHLDFDTSRELTNKHTFGKVDCWTDF